MSDKKNMKLFSLNSNPEIAQKIADHAGVPLGKISSRQFSDGEIQVFVDMIFISFNQPVSLSTIT